MSLTDEYPPSTGSPDVGATPTRTRRLNSRGTVVPAVELAMATLQAIHPRRIFPADGRPDENNVPTFCPVGWLRGGTSPGGADVGGPKHGNYFVGNDYRKVASASPQRIVWVPTRDDWGPPAAYGAVADPSIADLPELKTPMTPATEEAYRTHSHLAAVPWASRTINLDAHVWGSDFDDTEELVHWLASAWQLCFQGTAGDTPIVGPGEWIEDEKGTRGLHYVLSCRVGAPVVFPPYLEIVATQAVLRIRSLTSR